LSVETADHSAVVTAVQLDSVTEELEIDEAVMADVIPGAAAELVFRYHRGRDKDTSAPIVCRATPAVACSDPIALAGVNHAVAWTADVTFESGAAVLSATSGKPDAAEIGRKPLVFR